MDSTLEGETSFSFGITLGDQTRRKLLKKSGMNGEEVTAEMKTLSHTVRGLFNLNGMRFRTFAEKYALQRMAVEARTGLYKAADGVQTLEGFANADKALAEYLEGEEIEFLHAQLATSPWHIPGRKKLSNPERMERAMGKLEDAELLEAKEKLEAIMKAKGLI